MNASKSTRRVDLVLSGHLPDGEILDEVFANGSARVETGLIHGVELAPRASRIFAKLAPG
jgi:neopullulanase